ncbi:hypothetical protein BZB76_2889 [Actinomadura pelletieri DSM 43383]|uniref:Uncharacterized protein n=1 Tax=Actinomadura pelletieri DSM 43383 TaxID=1120940 RepID=A0A495QN69_9ACTN|nr:hypothetical protein BZB76_2889 [Actinomadura pelletieri DSM 43383]
MQTVAELAPVIGGVLNVVAAGIGIAAAIVTGWRRR